MFFLKNIFTAVITSSIFLFMVPSFAKSLNLYEQPQPNAKVIGTVDSEVGIIPIFTPKAGEWIKVGDPRNGNVGWITAKELKASNTKGGNFSFRVISTGEGPNSYQIVQFGTPKELPNEDAKALFKKMELRQQQIQKDMQKLMNDLFSNANWDNFPILAPVVVAPASQNTANKPTPPSGQTPAKTQ